MARIRIIRRGAKSAVSMDARVAHALVKNGTFNYVDTEVSEPKPKAKAKNEPRSDAPKKEAAAVAKKKSLTAQELNQLTVSQLREMASSAGITIEAGSLKSDIISALLAGNSYSRRDMRAE